MDDRLRELLAINRAITGTLDHEEILDLIVDKTMQLTGADACALLLAEDEVRASLVAHRGLDDTRVASFTVPFDERMNGALRRLFAHEREHDFVAVPIVRKGSVRGLLAIYGQRENWDDPEFRLVLAALADQAAIALDHASRYRELWQDSQRAREALETASRRKDEFLAMLAHELRNPLAAIGNAIEILQMRTANDEQIERARCIASRQVGHMKRLLDDLLDVSRVTQGKIQLDRQRVNVAEIVRQALDSTGPVIDENHHAVHLELAETPIYVDGDTHRLTEVISNLLTNAAKYTPPGGNIRVSARSAGGQAEVSVQDDGFGIAEELRDSVFDLFFQVPQAVNRPGGGGLGVGLTLVRHLVELHGGTVEAHSAGAGQGSEFIVRLPVSSDSEAQAPAEDPQAESAAKQRILLVEDNADTADMLAVALKAEGHEVEIARDGEAALAAVSDGLPDVVLVDIGLPDMDGFTLTRRMRQLPGASDLVIVTVSGYGDEKRRRDAHEAGVDHHLIKPVNAQELSRLLSLPRPKPEGPAAGR